MSAEALPIDPMRFAEALTDLPASTIALKLLELRNSVAHLDYSNAELKPFAEGTAATLDQQSQQQQQQQPPQPDQDCIDAIAENETVIARMQARIELIRAEVERRGLSWQAFQSKGKDEGAAETAAPANGVNGHEPSNGPAQPQHPAWSDGTFQTGTLRAGMTDEELLQQLQGRIPQEGADQAPQDDPDGGMHL